MENTTRQHLPLAFFRNVADGTLKTLRCKGADVGIRLLTPAAMVKLSEVYRGKRKLANVLSFSYDETSLRSSTISGDIALCPEVAQKEAETLGQTLEKRLAVLLVHGIVHLAGYTHASKQQAELMEAMEGRIARKLKLDEGANSKANSK